MARPRLGAAAGIAFAIALLAVPAAIELSAQFLPRPPRDNRPQSARVAFDAGRFEEASRIYSEYLDDNPDDAESWLFYGWSRYRLGHFAESRALFRRTLRLDPESIDARVGLGYALLQIEGPVAAAREFTRAIDRDPVRGDALRGLVLAGRREGAPAWVVVAGRNAAAELERLEGRDVDVLMNTTTLRAGVERRPRAPRNGDDPPRVVWSAGETWLEQLSDGRRRPLFIKGITLSTSLPGRYPSDHPTDEQTYREWLGIIAETGFNTVRAQSLLPPAFYNALHWHNERSGGAHLWLLQGVWLEAPEQNDPSTRDYEIEAGREIARVVDAVHGNLAIGPRPGRSWGSYDRDVSPWLIGYLFGRNWEPFVVQRLDRGGGRRDWEGRWIAVSGGSVMERWLGRMLDQIVEHEYRGYGEIRPVAFTNWPGLDPLTHVSESSRDEENRWRSEHGLRPLPTRAENWEYDVAQIDASLIRASGRNEAGTFAAYQIYPAFPDFMTNEYRAVGETSGFRRYLGALKEHHRMQAVVVSETGISTSRGMAHYSHDGRHHGGLEEAAQGRLLGEMIAETYDARFAGAILYSFFDEWSRSTWNTATFEIPSERSILWLNRESPEQQYGLMATRPGSATVRIDGRTDDWSEVAAYARD